MPAVGCPENQLCHLAGAMNFDVAESLTETLGIGINYGMRGTRAFCKTIDLSPCMCTYSKKDFAKVGPCKDYSHS